MADVVSAHIRHQGPRNYAATSRGFDRRQTRFHRPPPLPYPFKHILPKESLEGIERHRTRGVTTEICIQYLRGRCQWESLCYRIHPVNKIPFLKLLDEISTADVSDNHSSTPVVGVVGSGDITSPERVGSPLIEGSCAPVIKLPTAKFAEFQAQNPDSLRSDNTDYRSWLSRSSTPAEQDGTSESTVLSKSPTWNPETGDWGELTANSWLDDDSSRTPLSDLSVHPLADSDARDRMTSSPPSQYLEKCETWLDTVQKPNPPRPSRYPEKCRNWFQNRCSLGYSCRYVHDDLEYDEASDDHKPWFTITDDNKSWLTTIHDHIRVKIAAGFETESVITGFEIPYIFVHGIPQHIKTDEMLEFLKPFGNVYGIRMVDKSLQSTKSARVHFSKPEEAQAALSSLKQVDAFGTSISAELPVSASGLRNILFKDGILIEWAPPGRTWFAGYKDLVLARESIAQARALTSGSRIDAQIHTGLPAAGPVTVRFRGLPGHLEEDDLQKFGKPTSIMWEKAKYMDLSRVTHIIKSKLEGFGKLLSFNVDQPSGKEYMVKAFARFALPSTADEACRSLHGFSPHFTGRTKIYAHHDMRIECRISDESYTKSSSEIENLRQYVWHRFRHGASVIISGHNPVVVELHARELKILGQIKLEFEKILSGDVVRHEGRVAWDDYFATPLGIQYIQSLQVHHREINIRIEFKTHKIRLFGPLYKRQFIAQQIAEKVLELRAQQVSFIPLSRFIGVFMSQELLALQRDLGSENVVLDNLNRRLKVRGDNAVYRRALDLVRQICKRYSTGQYPSAHLCPVCLDKPTDSTRLPCGHLWCRTCLSSYLVASISSTSFPLCCLGDEAQCKQKIPLFIAKHLLSAQEFQSLVEASFSAHVQRHSDEFHYCPSPDCPQVYRAAPKTLAGTTVQCPSCLLRICPACHQEAHEGFACADDEEWDKDFKEWAKDHDVKRCPGCRITIERVEGCNHMTCTQCLTHICWVCMATFPKGEGIYGHMRSVHGDFGLGPIV
ncbi:hypothetical protein M378DRAFT_1055929 [Amanita muscaria Koide BX008]|uniref:RBR-type E3 ubiquitin transferase n=1 Tax=Amanita muscaria (strain Koide BX008) TaxID=946122 RepID=A0A0C2WL11_AMAMK|nr:hypothetical protein M378DRAFT_1055929 [Amanita muscaria Koide BX008]